MIPKTPAECDAFIANVSAAILAAMNTGRRIPPTDTTLTVDQLATVENYHKAARLARAIEAVAEASALLAELQLHARVQRLEDGFPLAESATDPTKRFCAHGISFADECATCAAGGNALEEFGKGLRGDPSA